jgi:hypothetical protein
MKLIRKAAKKVMKGEVKIHFPGCHASRKEMEEINREVYSCHRSLRRSGHC